MPLRKAIPQDGAQPRATQLPAQQTRARTLPAVDHLTIQAAAVRPIRAGAMTMATVVVTQCRRRRSNRPPKLRKRVSRNSFQLCLGPAPFFVKVDMNAWRGLDIAAGSLETRTQAATAIVLPCAASFIHYPPRSRPHPARRHDIRMQHSTQQANGSLQLTFSRPSLNYHPSRCVKTTRTTEVKTTQGRFCSARRSRWENNPPQHTSDGCCPVYGYVNPWSTWMGSSVRKINVNSLFATT